MEVITDKEIPISEKWLIKPVVSTVVSGCIGTILYTVLILFVSHRSTLTAETTIAITQTLTDASIKIMLYAGAFFVTFTLLASVLAYIVQLLRKNTFSYRIEEDFMIFHQGILSKLQKNLPYSVIQNLIVTQDLWDRLLGIYNLKIQNAAAGNMVVYSAATQGSTIGFYGNNAVIPGLTKENLDRLQSILTTKMLTKKPADRTSGL